MASIAASDIEAALRAALAPQALEVVDDSARHAGHRDAATAAHFSVRIVSPRFNGLPLVARHRLVYAALSAQFAAGLHALSIEAKAPDE